MIIQIRGTSGSGKSTVMGQMLEELGPFEEQCVGGNIVAFTPKTRPLYYTNKECIILGPYHTGFCKGCDAIGKPDGSSGGVPTLYGLIQSLKFDYLLCEGLLLSEDVKWTIQMEDVHVLFLVTPLEECICRVTKRQKQKGRKPKDPARVRRKLTTRVGTIERARLRLVDAGVLCRRASSTQAHRIILSWIKNCHSQN